MFYQTRIAIRMRLRGVMARGPRWSAGDPLLTRIVAGHGEGFVGWFLCGCSVAKCKYIDYVNNFNLLIFIGRKYVKVVTISNIQYGWMYLQPRIGQSTQSCSFFENNFLCFCKNAKYHWFVYDRINHVALAFVKLQLQCECYYDILRCYCQNEIFENPEWYF